MATPEGTGYPGTETQEMSACPTRKTGGQDKPSYALLLPVSIRLLKDFCSPSAWWATSNENHASLWSERNELKISPIEGMKQ